MVVADHHATVWSRTVGNTSRPAVLRTCCTHLSGCGGLNSNSLGQPSRASSEGNCSVEPAAYDFIFKPTVINRLFELITFCPVKLRPWLSPNVTRSTIEQQSVSNVSPDADPAEAQKDMLQLGTASTTPDTAVAIWHPLKLSTTLSAQFVSKPNSSNHSADALTNTGMIVSQKRSSSVPHRIEASASESEQPFSQLQLQWQNSTCAINSSHSPIDVAPVLWQTHLLPPSIIPHHEHVGSTLYDTSWPQKLEEDLNQQAVPTAQEVLRESLQLVQPSSTFIAMFDCCCCCHCCCLDCSLSITIVPGHLFKLYLCHSRLHACCTPPVMRITHKVIDN